MSAPLQFDIIAREKEARTGIIRLQRGEIRTPAFMPVGTAGTVKAAFPDTVAATGADIILGNTYHLMLRPGAERIACLGGLHSFMNWPKPILTDSGGYQVMSLAKIAKVTEEGVYFQSHLDGSSHLLTPERAIEIQDLLSADISMVFDECLSYPASYEATERSMELSLRWAERSRRAFPGRNGRALFAIVQGGMEAGLRQRSAAALVATGFDGYAVGGLAVGEGPDLMAEMLDITVPCLPAEKPRYLMGVGPPRDIIAAVTRGIDMFDCVMPTRAGRHGQAFTKSGTLNLRNAAFADDPRPLDESSDCPASRDYSRAYLHHLIKAGEMLGGMLLTWHNLRVYQQLMAGLRQAIAERRLEEYAREWAA
jgi:queuine tRNA-ribosyltransferase